ncbi:MAG: hypothetical protein KGQ41_05590, partial [Alphaproteobacteria bacterium]|nr:hypothetical protein [Alphaproteobacteria bacterium]
KAENLFGKPASTAWLQNHVERTIPVHMEGNLQAFVADVYPSRQIAVKTYLFDMPNGNLHMLDNGTHGTYTKLTHHAPRDLKNLPHVCEQTGRAFRIA